MVKKVTFSPLLAKKKVGLKSHVNKFRKFTKHPEDYLKLQKPLAKKLKLYVKEIYDHGAKNPTAALDEPLPYLDELVTDEMDDEQIWQQLELKNEYFIEQDLKKFLDVVSKNEKRLQLSFSTKSISQDGSDEGSSVDEMHESDEENGVNGDAMDSEAENEANGDGIDSEEETAPEKVKKSKKKENKQSKSKKSIVDDRFFRLDDMARFLDLEDDRERRKQNGLSEKNPLIEIDYFDEHTGEDDGDEADLKYADFFEDEDDEEDDSEDDESEADEHDNIEDEANNDEADDDGEENDLEQEQEGELSDEAEVERNRKLRFAIYQEGGGLPLQPERPAKNPVIEQPESSDSASEGEKSQDKDDVPKSSYEIRQQKLKEKITQMESKLLKEKPWQLKGEISAETRPKNSLLEEVLEYEHTTRPAPVITEETTMRLEDIIKQRIRNKAYDDVERKVRPPDNPREYRKQLVLDGEKSKESLAKVYEQDYLKQLEKANPDADVQANEDEEPKEHKEIRNMMKAILAQLDALSNFHYTPRPAAPDLKILTNTPAISMEEVAPVATSDATLLAPEEVHRRPKGDVMSKEERTKTDQNRERRLKKRFQQEKFRREAEREQKQLEKAAGKSNSKQNRALQTSLLKKVTKAKNVQQMVETSSGPAKSSSAFFSQLQDEVRSQVKAKADGVAKKKKKNTETLIASNFKL
ncbi:U3 small nucleolar ribonucleoprotein protein MPP10 [Anopheles marshallii]|uniref:U3 small nucleolar ribonucleoprotein protein MPP10 n=1 Tax=Anopheles marshallii TaxID=1521116 RepID=UPI00237B5FFC|nr:U3 small nucleolar ribonucleoprotein protein MPP10 [Anopheles marshallii]